MTQMTVLTQELSIIQKTQASESQLLGYGLLDGEQLGPEVRDCITGLDIPNKPDQEKIKT